MKKLLLLLFIICWHLTLAAQKISDAFLNEEINAGSNKQEPLFLQHIFLLYQQETGKNLDNSSKLFFLRCRQQGNTKYYAWNDTDTIYTSVPYRSISADDLNTIKIQSIKVDPDTYTKTLINIISNLPDEELKKFLNKDNSRKKGEVIVIADEPSYELYIFEKTGDAYKIHRERFGYKVID